MVVSVGWVVAVYGGVVDVGSGSLVDVDAPRSLPAEVQDAATTATIATVIRCLLVIMARR
jgi:hypothetical protein